jgi:hypothetical protein
MVAHCGFKSSSGTGFTIVTSSGIVDPTPLLT